MTFLIYILLAISPYITFSPYFIGANSSSSKAQQQQGSTSRQQSTSKPPSGGAPPPTTTTVSSPATIAAAATAAIHSLSTTLLVDENLPALVAFSFHKAVPRHKLIKFSRTYLLEAAQPNIRSSAHILLFNLYKNCSPSDASLMYESLLSMWSDVMHTYGSKASQYVDLLGYIALTQQQQQSLNFLQKCIDLYKTCTQNILHHPNSQLYTTLSHLLNENFDGYYLEADPCFTCNNIEQPMQTIKLNSIKSDCRFTTNQQIFKLANTYSISRLHLKVSEIRKIKITIFFI